MKKLINILIMCFCCSVFGAKAQTYVNTYANVSVDSSSPVTTQVSNVRYEFVQSTLNSTHAFLIDKFTGRVWRYRILKKEFDEIQREQPDTVSEDRVNYQLYMSGENNSMCFLLNVHTGEMWRYASKEGGRTFTKMVMPWESKQE